MLQKIHKHMLDIIAGAFLLLFLCWMIGYFADALYDMKFEIKSCWDGFTTLSGAGILAVVRYIMDSWKNSDNGVNPYEDKKMGDDLHEARN
ncbi:hypothetical protein [Megasphaera sueciensis]|uniref:hypothetical protein n=1 Tax=Megasphaera sueciensis TaxID=349094 RepID=UPI003D028367